jgi:CrcB protein
MKPYLLIFIGGGVGSIIRFALSRWVYQFLPPPFPNGTLVVNFTACFVLGLLVGLATTKGYITPDIKLLVAVGFCGGFSTFSTFSLETLELMQMGQWLWAAGNVVFSVAGCFVTTLAGLAFSKLF